MMEVNNKDTRYLAQGRPTVQYCTLATPYYYTWHPLRYGPVIEFEHFQMTSSSHCIASLIVLRQQLRYSRLVRFSPKTPSLLHDFIVLF